MFFKKSIKYDGYQILKDILKEEIDLKLYKDKSEILSKHESYLQDVLQDIKNKE